VSETEVLPYATGQAPSANSPYALRARYDTGEIVRIKVAELI
jgi:hypothetical protein